MNILNFAFLLLFQSSFPHSSPLPGCKQEQKRDKAAATNIIFRSTDGGQSWQDISKGLPENSQGAGFIANDNGLYLHAGNGIYHSKQNSTAPFWKNEISFFPDTRGMIAAGNARLVEYNFYWQFLSNSTNSGKAWKTLISGRQEMKIVESNGVLLAGGSRGIMRSTDNGESWYWVIREGGVGIDVANIKGGFAAITYSSASNTRRVRTSYDDGKTWQPIDAGLPAQLSISSIIEVGENFFCGHPKGIFRSSDKGKTWELLLPSIENKVFNLFVSGNVIYAIPRFEGC